MLIDYSHLHREVLREDLPSPQFGPEKSTDDDDHGWNYNYHDGVENIDKIDDKNDQKHTNIMTFE